MEKWFGNSIIEWYHKNKRDLPWRREKNAYKIWLSEIILQQTQVAQGLSYYLKFTENYPTVTHLANASEDEVLRLWQGLGYYSRARNLHYSAKQIKNDFNGIFPDSHGELKQLKGVGDYTAAAIVSFAYNLPHAVVDGNVYRLLSRVFGIKTPIDSSRAKKEFQQLADELLDKKNPGIYNQAIMEFGSQFCKPVNPFCEECVLRSKCYALKTKTVSQLPFKAKKTKVRNRYFNYVVVTDKNKNILLNKRTGSGIWQGLYEFTLIETDKTITSKELLKSNAFKAITTSGYSLVHVSKPYKHVLSHQNLFAKFYVIKLAKSLPSSHRKSYTSKQLKIKLPQLTHIALPRLIVKFLDDCDLKEIL